MVLALALVTAAPTVAFAGMVGTMPDCPTVSSAGGDDSCCGESGSLSGCDLACAVSAAAIAAHARKATPAERAGAPRARQPVDHELISRPPDTAPPKALRI